MTRPISNTQTQKHKYLDEYENKNANNYSPFIQKNSQKWIIISIWISRNPMIWKVFSGKQNGWIFTHLWTKNINIEPNMWISRQILEHINTWLHEYMNKEVNKQILRLILIKRWIFARKVHCCRICIFNDTLVLFFALDNKKTDPTSLQIWEWWVHK